MENAPNPSESAPQSPSPTGTSPGFTPEEQSWAIALHLCGFAGFLLPSLGQIVIPLVIWLIKRPESPYLDRVGKEVLNFQISYTLYASIGAASIFLCIGIFLLPILLLIPVLWAVFMIVAAVKTSNGESYQYPFTIRFLQ